jgi:hypothetical protein
MTKEKELEIKERVMVEFMKTVMGNDNRLEDYVEDENIFESISKDSKQMADEIIKQLKKK